MAQSELQLQAECFQWAWNYYPETRLCLWHVTNEMKPYPTEQHAAFKTRIAKAKAAGLVPGVFDLHFFWDKEFHVFELKVEYNKLSDSQIKFQAKMILHGAFTYEIRELETFQRIFLTIINDKS